MTAAPPAVSPALPPARDTLKPVRLHRFSGGTLLWADAPPSAGISEGA